MIAKTEKQHELRRAEELNNRIGSRFVVGAETPVEYDKEIKS
jgi:hypothetical protein